MNRTHVLSLRNATAGLVLAAASLCAAPAARADLPFPPSPREVHREIRGVVHDVLRALDRIPVALHRDVAHDLEVFFVGSPYYGPHRHHHSVYSFPVWIDGSVSYRPFVYCNDRLFDGYASRPRLWSGWGEPSDGRYCDHHRAWYPSAHACFRGHVAPRYGAHHGSGHRSDYGPQYRQGYRQDYRPEYRHEYRHEYRREYRQPHRPQSRPHCRQHPDADSRHHRH